MNVLEKKLKNGIINLDKINKEIIDGKNAGSCSLNSWFLNQEDNIEYLFKSDIDPEYVRYFSDSLKEVYAFHIAKALNISHAKYYYAKMNGILGTITPSFLKNKQKSISIGDFINTDEDYVILKEVYKEFKNRKLSDNMIYKNIDLLIKYQILNIMIAQRDHQFGNIDMIYTENKNDFTVAPKFDNANSFSSFDDLSFNKSNKTKIVYENVYKKFKNNLTGISILDNKTVNSVDELLNSMYGNNSLEMPKILKKAFDNNIETLDTIVNLDTSSIVFELTNNHNFIKDELVWLNKIFKIHQNIMKDEIKKYTKK